MWYKFAPVVGGSDQTDMTERSLMTMQSGPFLPIPATTWRRLKLQANAVEPLPGGGMAS
jgi:hypothetical protein